MFRVVCVTLLKTLLWSTIFYTHTCYSGTFLHLVVISESFTFNLHVTTLNSTDSKKFLNFMVQYLYYTMLVLGTWDDNLYILPYIKTFLKPTDTGPNLSCLIFPSNSLIKPNTFITCKNNNTTNVYVCMYSFEQLDSKFYLYGITYI